jgi:uncharacterized damage-inducible protein DinB
MRQWYLVIAFTVGTAGAAAAQGASDPLTAATRQSFQTVRGYVVKSAEKMPEADYAFKPAPEVRSFGALLGHIANANYMICARAAGEKSPAPGDIEKTKTTKAELVEALNGAFAYCDKVLGSMTDAKGLEMVDFFGGKQPRLAVLAFNTAHTYEHYGNLVTYMRIKGLVPPSSERPSQ